MVVRLVAMVEGMVAGVHVTSADITTNLPDRRLGLRRGARMKVRKGQSPCWRESARQHVWAARIAVEIGNTEWPKWENGDGVRPVEADTLAQESARNRAVDQARPGHATTRACSNRFRRCAPGARTRGAPARPRPGWPRNGGAEFLRQGVGRRGALHIIAIGGSEPYRGPPPQAADLDAIDESPVRAFARPPKN